MRAFGNSQLSQLGSDRSPVSRRLDLLVDVLDFSITADVERPARDAGGGDAVGLCHLPRRITQKRVIHTQGLRIRFVRFLCIDADGKKRDVERPDFIPALTERLAFRRSTAAERLDKPDEHYRLLATEISQVIRLAVRSHERERRRRITGL